MTTMGADGQYLLNIMANYIILDGIEFDGNFNSAAATPATSSTVFSNCIGALGAAPHHLVIENNSVHGCGSSGIGFTGNDYLWIVNNLVYDNNYANFTNEGNGIYILTPANPSTTDSTYDPANADDSALLNHIVIAYNVVHDNMVGPSGCFPEDGITDPYNQPNPDASMGLGCGTNDGTVYTNGTSHTGGHGIMLQSFEKTSASKFDLDHSFAEPTIVVGNQLYNNGGNGVNVWRSGFMTVVNNSTYNNALDPEWNNDDGRYYRGGISCTYCRDTNFTNNIGVAVVPDVLSSPGGNAYPSANVCALTMDQAHNEADQGQSVDQANIIWKSNLSYIYAPNGGGGCNSPYPGVLFMGSGTPADAATNIWGTDPMFTNPTATPLADLSLQSGSPAIGQGTAGAWMPTLSNPNIGSWQQ